jgi:hypothetical protein
LSNATPVKIVENGTSPASRDTLVIASGIESVIGDQQATDEKAHAVDRIESCEGAKTAETRIEHSHHSDQNNRATQEHFLVCNPGQPFEINHADQPNRTTI